MIFDNKYIDLMGYNRYFIYFLYFVCSALVIILQFSKCRLITINLDLQIHNTIEINKI